MTPQYLLWGATWGNNMAQLEWWLAFGALAWIAHRLGLLAWLTGHAGRHLAAWWDKHHGPHAVKRQKQALAEHEAEKRAAAGTESEGR